MLLAPHNAVREDEPLTFETIGLCRGDQRGFGDMPRGNMKASDEERGTPEAR
jgi:hypothetical protein